MNIFQGWFANYLIDNRRKTCKLKQMIPTKEDVEFLSRLDFHLELDGKTFYSDKWSKGNSYIQIHFDEAYNKWCIYRYNANNEEVDSYEYVNKLDEVHDFL